MQYHEQFFLKLYCICICVFVCAVPYDCRSAAQQSAGHMRAQAASTEAAVAQAQRQLATQEKEVRSLRSEKAALEADKQLLLAQVRPHGLSTVDYMMFCIAHIGFM